MTPQATYLQSTENRCFSHLANINFDARIPLFSQGPSQLQSLYNAHQRASIKPPDLKEEERVIDEHNFNTEKLLTHTGSKASLWRIRFPFSNLLVRRY